MARSRAAISRIASLEGDLSRVIAERDGRAGYHFSPRYFAVQIRVDDSQYAPSNQPDTPRGVTTKTPVDDSQYIVRVKNLTPPGSE